MVSINQVTIAGRLTKDPELHYTKNGIPVANISIAINEKVKKGDEWVDETLFIDRITVWQKQAENVTEYLSKGKLVLIEGKLKMNSWKTDSGEKRNNLEIVAIRVHFLSPKDDEMQQIEKEFTQPKKLSQNKIVPMNDENIPF